MIYVIAIEEFTSFGLDDNGAVPRCDKFIGTDDIIDSASRSSNTTNRVAHPLEMDSAMPYFIIYSE
jgi:hypothetical protein